MFEYTKVMSLPRMLRLIAASLILSATVGQRATAEPQTIEGPATQVQLVELFTSEGCSSCPPADAFLGALERDPGLWQRFAPIGLHVDYWDELGWPDRFARALYSERQRHYVKLCRARDVYTPGFFLDGREWRGWFEHRGLPASKGATVGSLRLVVDGTSVSVDTRATGLSSHAKQLHVALLGVGLTSRVRGGENGGRTLQHAFVALSTADAPFVGGSGKLTLAAPGTHEMPRRTAVVAWVTADGDPTPLQVVGGWLPNA